MPSDKGLVEEVKDFMELYDSLSSRRSNQIKSNQKN